MSGNRSRDFDPTAARDPCLGTQFMTWHHRWIPREWRPPTSTDEAPIDWTVKAAPGVDAGSSDDSLGTTTTSRARRRRAANIYGTIVTAAVIAAGGNTLSSAQLAVTIIVTLIVYWLAEQYAELLGAHTHGGHLPSAALVR